MSGDKRILFEEKKKHGLNFSSNTFCIEDKDKVCDFSNKRIIEKRTDLALQCGIKHSKKF